MATDMSICSNASRQRHLDSKWRTNHVIIIVSWTFMGDNCVGIWVLILEFAIACSYVLGCRDLPGIRIPNKVLNKGGLSQVATVNHIFS